MSRALAASLVLVAGLACERSYPTSRPHGTAGSGGEAGAGGGGSGGAIEPAASTLWAQGPDTLFELDAATLEVQGQHAFAFPEDELAEPVWDVASSRRGVLLALTGGGRILEVDPETGALTHRVTLPIGGNSLGFAPGPDGKDLLLVGTQDGVVYAARPDGTIDELGRFPAGLSGDFAWVPGVGLVSTVRTEGGDSLAVLDLVSGEARVVGPVGASRVYGVALGRDALLGFADDGSVLRLDPLTGAGELEASTGLRFWGAASPGG